MIVPRHVLGRGFVAPSDKLVIASVGTGGKGQSDIANFFASGQAEIAYLCDVDDRRSAKTRAGATRRCGCSIRTCCIRSRWICICRARRRRRQQTSDYQDCYH